MSAPWLDDGDVALYHGGALDVLRSLPAGSVQTCVTSPPYWGLRDYGTGSWNGGSSDCDHRKPNANKVFGNPAFNENRPSREQTQTAGYRDECGRCGARRVDAQLGLEPTPSLYVAALVAVFAEVWRVLRADGTLWLNLGDSYASNGVRGDTRGGFNERYFGNGAPGKQAETIDHVPASTVPPGLKAKDLVGIPWRVAFALQEAGWYLRSDIIWSKPAPMPESVTDRPTKSHEYLFLLTKQPRYFYDNEAIREPHSPDGRSVTTRTVANGSHDNYQEFGHDEGRERWPNGGRNARSVWSINPQPFSARALDDGTLRKASPDCPVHGTPDQRASVPLGDEHATGQSTCNGHSDARPALEPLGEPAASAHDQAVAPSDASSATRHSNGTSKTDAPSAQRDTGDARSSFRTAYMPGQLDLGATTDRSPESRSEAGSGVDATDPDPSAETLLRSARKSCTCQYTDHFAVFPEALVRRCILAGSSEAGGCSVCGAPWRRVVERGESDYSRLKGDRGWRDLAEISKQQGKGVRPGQAENRATHANHTMTERGTVPSLRPRPSNHVGWEPSCSCSSSDSGSLGCADAQDTRSGVAAPGSSTTGIPAPSTNASPVPQIVLDPFVGSGTTALVARKHGRRAIGIDLSADYLAIAARRLGQQSLFATSEGVA